MRRLIFSIVLISVGLILLVACAGVAMTDLAPISPVSHLFPLQRTFELSKAWLIRDNTDRAYYFISLADRRAHDLENIGAISDEQPTLTALNQAFDQAQGAIEAAPPETQGQLVEALVKVAENAYNILTQLPFQDPDPNGLYPMVKSRLDVIRLILHEPKVVTEKALTKANYQILMPLISFDGDPSAFPNDANLSNPLNIQFPPGSPGATHAFFPLLGQHALLGCEQCHVNGQFSGTSTSCIACHANVVPISHYQGECSACHTPNAWKDIHFNHAAAGATNCQSCHNPDKPANHFSGQCSACHNTTAWRQATFNHKVA